jgi:hypothetical protein
MNTYEYQVTIRPFDIPILVLVEVEGDLDKDEPTLISDAIVKAHDKLLAEVVRSTDWVYRYSDVVLVDVHD